MKDKNVNIRFSIDGISESNTVRISAWIVDRETKEKLRLIIQDFKMMAGDSVDIIFDSAKWNNRYPKITELIKEIEKS